MSLFRLQYKPLVQICSQTINRSTKSAETMSNQSRLYHLITRNYGRRINDLKTPDLIYFPQILRWMKTKIGFKVLQKTWDPDFSEGAFIYGSTRAICRITEEIGVEDKNDELKNLVTPALRKKLHVDIVKRMSLLQKRVIILSPRDIKLLIPTEVRLFQVDNKKQCSIALRTLAVKWHDLNGALRLAIIALQTEFIRDYTHQNESDSGWIVRVFDILECGVVGDAKILKK